MSAQLPTTTPTTPPSAIFIYSSSSDPAESNPKPPLSPTSSIKGCFVRSRPTSTDFDFEFEYEYSTLPNFAVEPGVAVASQGSGSVTTTPTTATTMGVSDDDLLERASLAQMAKDSDARSLAPSTLTCTDRRPVVPVRIIRRSDVDADVDAVAEKEGGEGKEGDAMRARRRTWPSYKAIRRTVSNILHRKEASVTTATVKEAKGALIGPEPAAVEKVKSSSASLFTKRRRATVSNSEKKKGAPVMHRAASSRAKPTTRAQAQVLQHTSHLWRSRSFSGFTNVLAAIDDADDDLDELTTEARGVVLDIRRRWDFEEVEEVPEDAALMFERCIE